MSSHPHHIPSPAPRIRLVQDIDNEATSSNGISRDPGHKISPLLYPSVWILNHSWVLRVIVYDDEEVVASEVGDNPEEAT